jgi:hypothetical protein
MIVAAMATCGAVATARADGPAKVELTFERLPKSTAFDAVMHVLDRAGKPADSLVPTIASSRGKTAPMLARGPGVYSVRITPDALGSGEYTVTAAIPGARLSATRTALVMAAVDDRWGQPQRVEGLVNTPGWEDGAHISRDGEWLFVQYVAQSPSCLIEGNVQAFKKARGPWTGPARPNFPAASRISADGTIRNAAPSLGLNEAVTAMLGLKLVAQAVYGFKRQPNGDFAEPFLIDLAGNDGAITVTGPVLVPDAGGHDALLFAWEDPRLDKSLHADWDHWVAPVVLGKRNVLGRYERPWPTIKDWTPVLVGGKPLPGRQGNPGPYVDSSGQVVQIWYDDETLPDDKRDVLVRVLKPGGRFPEGPWRDPLILPPPVNEPNVGEIQPVFDGKEVTLRRGHAIVSIPFHGKGPEDLANPRAWGKARNDLVAEPLKFAQRGPIISLGEPSKAVRKGRTSLYFVYALRGDDGLLDMNVGFVEEVARRRE